jgi:hypothetical protein
VKPSTIGKELGRKPGKELGKDLLRKKLLGKERM